MWWTVVGLVVVAGFAWLLIRDMLREPNIGSRVAALLVVGAGVAVGADLWLPWLPLGMLAAAFAIYFVSHDDDRATSP